MQAKTLVLFLGSVVLSVFLVAAGVTLLRQKKGTPYHPRLLQNFVSSEEAAAIIQEATDKGLSRSTVLSKDNPTQQSRTSRHVFLSPDTSPTAAAIMHRASKMLGIPLSHFEQMQVAVYEEGQEYQAHYDACKKCTASNKDLARLYTLLIYLSDDFQGGHTVFPNCDVDVTPKKGMGVLWRNIDEHGHNLESSFHAGKPVVGPGLKWICTLWIHGQPYRSS